MTGHRPFKDLWDKMPPESRARIERRVQETLNKDMAEERNADDSNAPLLDERQTAFNEREGKVKQVTGVATDERK